MKTIYIRSLMLDIWKKRRIVIASIIIFTIAFSILGYKNASKEMSPENAQKLADYNQAIEDFDKILNETNENIALLESQVEESQKYCDNSIYMQIDSQNIQTSTTQYAIKDNGSWGYILNAFVTYINDGSLKEEIADALPDVSTEYLKEIISCYTNGDALSVSVIHYDAEKAQQIMDQANTRITQHKKDIVSVWGEFAMEKMNATSYSRADVNVLNTQNSNLNNLRNYKNSLADYQKKLIDQTTAKNNYIKNYAPGDLAPDSPKKSAVKYAILGFIFGVIFPCAVFALQFIASDRLRDPSDLLNAGIAVLGCLNEKKGYSPVLSRSAVDIALIAKNFSADTVFLNCIGNDELFRKVSEDYTAELKKDDIAVLSGYDIRGNAEELKSMLRVNNCILVAEAGKTRYAELDEQVQLCKKFGISLWGCIVIE